jgi:Lipopolysaccharide kinase (Kdo/WaaP) family
MFSVRSPTPLLSYDTNIEISGPYIGFAGAAWNLRPNVQVLSTVLPLHFHHSDTRLWTTTARHLSALKKAISSLQEYYQVELPATTHSSPPQAPFPYARSFSSIEDSTTQRLTYLSQPLSDKLVFMGTLDTSKRVCVKFVQRYSGKAHSLCASMGFAPTLIGFERVPGGWYMVVMDALDKDYEQLDQLVHPSALDGITAKITSLHQAGYVHGDIRNTNVMVRKDGEIGFMLVDFDWAGEIGVIRYPMHVNREDITRPDGAHDGELITADHDVQMLETMLSTHLLPTPPEGQS